MNLEHIQNNLKLIKNLQLPLFSLIHYWMPLLNTFINGKIKNAS